jgi:hypothetical protein
MATYFHLRHIFQDEEILKYLIFAFVLCFTFVAEISVKIGNVDRCVCRFGFVIMKYTPYRKIFEMKLTIFYEVFICVLDSFYCDELL